MSEQTISIIAHEIAKYIAIKLAYPVYDEYAAANQTGWFAPAAKNRIRLHIGNTNIFNKKVLKIYIWDNAKVLCHPPGPPGPPDPDKFLTVDFHDPESWEVLTRFLCVTDYSAAEINNVNGVDRDGHFFDISKFNYYQGP